MKILVTGSNGYIGARLSKYLLNQKFEVRMSTRSPLTPSADFESAENVILDLENASEMQLEQACLGCDQVIHLANLNDQQCRENPERALRVNGLGTWKLLQACERTKISKFIYFSTAHVYGSPLSGNYFENSPTRPKTHYAITHRLAEAYVLSSNLQSPVVLRLSNAIGAPLFQENNCWMLLVNDLCRQVVTTNTMTLKSSGIAKRNFVALSDVESTINSLLHSKNPPATLNMMGRETFSILDMTKMIGERFNKLFDSNYKLIIPDVPPEPTPPNFSLQTLYLNDVSNQTSLVSAIDETLLFCQKFRGQNS